MDSSGPQCFDAITGRKTSLHVLMASGRSQVSGISSVMVPYRLRVVQWLTLVLDQFFSNPSPSLLVAACIVCASHPSRD
jgi:hypothetical protein